MFIFGAAAGILSNKVMIGFAIIAIIAFVVAFKIGQLLIRLIFGLVGIALLASVGWWFFIR